MYSVRRNHLYQLILVQFREFYREPGVLFWAIGFPILMAWGLGIAFNEKPEIIRKVAVVETQQTADTHLTTLQKFLGSETEVIIPDKSGKHVHTKHILDKKLGLTTYYFTSTDWKTAIVELKRGNVSLIITEKKGSIIYHFDPASPEARLVQLQLESIISGSKTTGESSIIEPLSLKGTRYIDFLVPGLIAMGIMMSCMWGISYTIIDNRAKKLLRRMVATPMKRSNFLVSLFAARFVLIFVETVFIYLFAYFYFGMEIQGSLTGLFVICLAGSIAFSGISILTAARTSKPEVGNGIINAVTTPMVVLSGIFFAYSNFPDWSIPFIKILPLTMLTDNIRAVFNEGAGFVEILMPSAILTFVGLVAFLLGLKIYKWY